MLKDIYSLGISLLELMIGRVSEAKFSITIDSLPLTWAELPESTPLILTLVECLNIDSVALRKGKLSYIKSLLVKESKLIFKDTSCFYREEYIYQTTHTDVLNKRAVFTNLKSGQEEEAMILWGTALDKQNGSNQHALLNLLNYRWRRGEITDLEYIRLIEDADCLNDKDDTYMVKGLALVGVGERLKGLDLLKSRLSELKTLDLVGSGNGVL